jgi:hypothetical protein
MLTPGHVPGVFLRFSFSHNGLCNIATRAGTRALSKVSYDYSISSLYLR